MIGFRLPLMIGVEFLFTNNLMSCKSITSNCEEIETS